MVLGGNTYGFASQKVWFCRVKGHIIASYPCFIKMFRVLFPHIRRRIGHQKRTTERICFPIFERIFSGFPLAFSYPTAPL